MQEKLAGSYDVYQNGGCSPTMHDRRGQLSQEFMFQSSKIASPRNLQPRFAEKDSLYLDLGKPEMNGKIDTLTSGSANNSLLLQKADCASPKIASPFSKNAMMRGSSFKNQVSGGNKDVLKAAIFRNMQNNNEDEEFKNENLFPIKSIEAKHDRRRSDVVRALKYDSDVDSERKSGLHEEEPEDISQENPQLQKNMEKLGRGTHIKHPSKLIESSPNLKMSLLSHRQKGF